MDKNLLQKVSLDDLKPEQREMAELLGLDAFLLLVEYYSGTYIYIPKADMVTLPIRDRVICEQYNGDNANELALKWNLSISRICEIVANKHKEIINAPPPGQLTLL